MSILNDKKRFVLEHAAMRERWGDRPRLRSDSSRTRVWWEYELRLEGNLLLIKIEYPSDYPASPPDVVIETSLPSGTPHVLPGNRMCWYYPGETARNRNIWSPSKDTAAVAVGAAYRWFLAFLAWRTLGEWPVPDAVG